MRNLLTTVLCFWLAFSAAALPGTAATRAKPVKKRAAKTAKKPGPAPAPGVKGTVQMAGDNGKMSVTYTIGKGDEAINFALLRAEFTTTRLCLTDKTVCPTADGKLLVLHFTIQNPNAKETFFNWATLKFTAVDSENANRESLGYAGKEGSGDVHSASLKPAQKIEVWNAFDLPAKLSVPKLIVQHGEDQPVLRLYFGPKDIKGLPAPLADPADPTGATARSEVPAGVNTYYPFANFDLKFISGPSGRVWESLFRVRIGGHAE